MPRTLISLETVKRLKGDILLFLPPSAAALGMGGMLLEDKRIVKTKQECPPFIRFSASPAGSEERLHFGTVLEQRGYEQPEASPNPTCRPIPFQLIGDCPAFRTDANRVSSKVVSTDFANWVLSPVVGS